MYTASDSERLVVVLLGRPNGCSCWLHARMRSRWSAGVTFQMDVMACTSRPKANSVTMPSDMTEVIFVRSTGLQ